MKTKFKEFLNENNHYNIDDIYFYKNQYMLEPKRVSVFDIEEYTNGKIESITIKTEDKKEIRLLPHEFKYLSKVKQGKDSYEIIEEIRTQISDICGCVPKQIVDLFNFIKSDKNVDIINIKFIEEVKDGRSSKFNINKPLTIKGKTFGTEEFKITITNIEYIDTIKQDSDYNEYYEYVYEIKIKKV